MTVKAKFRCNQVINTDNGNGHSSREVKFNAVYGKEGENASYSKATPSGNLSMYIDKETPAYDHFKPGKDYYLTFEEAPAQ
jgi:hypothetical protein